MDDEPLHIPYVFISYARDDARIEENSNRNYLKRFFNDLTSRIVFKSQFGVDKEVVFCDYGSINTGEDWKSKLEDALKKCKVLVCIYSPSYFTSIYCGKEFKVFIDRQNDVSLHEGEYLGSTKILPILWSSKNDLQLWDLPPLHLRRIQYSTQSHTQEYEKRGLKYFIRRYIRGKYDDILEEIANQILNLAIKNPLPSYQGALSIEDVVELFPQKNKQINSQNSEKNKKSTTATIFPQNVSESTILFIHLKEESSSFNSEHLPITTDRMQEWEIDSISREYGLIAKQYALPLEGPEEHFESVSRWAHSNNSLVVLIFPNNIIDKKFYTHWLEGLHNKGPSSFYAVMPLSSIKEIQLTKLDSSGKTNLYDRNRILPGSANLSEFKQCCHNIIISFLKSRSFSEQHTAPLDRHSKFYNLP